jgi:hypothetical protein
VERLPPRREWVDPRLDCTGKTLAAWIGPLLEWFADRGEYDARSVGARSDRKPRAGAPALRVLWLTPLRALAADTREALADVQSMLAPTWTVETRTGDTSPTMRARQAKRLPTALVTTPESLSLMLTRPNASELFEELRVVVVDEWLCTNRYLAMAAMWLRVTSIPASDSRAPEDCAHDFPASGLVRDARCCRPSAPLPAWRRSRRTAETGCLRLLTVR